MVGGRTPQANRTDYERDGAVVAEASSKNHAVSVWSEAHPLRGDDEPSQYEKVVLPLAVLRRTADAA